MTKMVEGRDGRMRSAARRPAAKPACEPPSSGRLPSPMRCVVAPAPPNSQAACQPCVHPCTPGASRLPAKRGLSPFGRPGGAHKATSRPMRAGEVLRCRVVHGGGRSALATNRPNAAVGNPCSTRSASCTNFLTFRRNAAEGVHRLPCPCGDCLRRLPAQGPCETRSPQGAGRPRRAPRCSATRAKLERLFMSSPPRLPTRTVIPQLQGVCP
jgi:hypothetical protein